MRKFVHQKLVLLTVLLIGAIGSYAQVTSNRGREFWVGYGHHQFMETGSNAMNMRLYLSTEDQPATVTVTIDSSGNPLLPVGTPGSVWTKVYNIPPYTAIQSDIIPKGMPNVAAAPGDVLSDAGWDARLWSLPNESGGTGGSGIFRKKGIHITSTAPITAYAHIYGSTSSGATMLIPVTAWGYEYVSLNSNQSYASNCYSWTYVVAYKDNTIIEITPSVKTRAQNRTGLRPGVTKRDTLMKGQIYQVIGANLGSDADGNGGTNSAGYNLSGTKIRSVAGPNGECYPIAVFAGSSRTSNVLSCGSGGGDNDNQQLFPYHAWGKRYLTAPFSASGNAATPQTSLYKITFMDPTTQVRRNGTLLPYTPGSLFYEFESSSAELIEADKPIMVNQFMSGGSCGAGGNGDPEMVVVAPVEQAIKEVTFYRQSREAIRTNYLTLIVPTEGLPSLRIDNSGIFDYTYPHPRNAQMGKDYTVVVKRWDIGAGEGYQCYVRCDSAFTAITYGLGSVESYAYSAGAYINNLNALTGLHNQPDTTNGGKEIHEYTGVGTPVDLSILIKYKPQRLTWKFSEMTPTSCWTANPAITGDYIMDPASTYLVDSPIINGTKYYRYKLPHTFTFNCTGLFEVPVEAYSVNINACGNRETFYPTIEVVEKPLIGWSYQHQTMCTKDSIYLEGPVTGLSGINALPLTQWRWLLPGGAMGHSKDTTLVLPPGVHQVGMIGVTNEGLLTDTVYKTITVYPPPTTVFEAVPTIACLGQSITFTQTASYGNPAIPITNYHWDFGDGATANNLVSPQVHNYASPDTYIAKAAVKVSDLCVSDTVTTTVIISPEAPIDFTYPTGCLPATGVAQFNAPSVDLGGAPIVSYSWNFGDPASGANNTSSAQNPSHTYSTFGVYPVTLTVTTNTGCTGDTTVNITFNVQPSLQFLPLTPVCSNGGPVNVARASVTNGIVGNGEYSGTGITDPITGTFDPAVAGPGTHTITFTFISNSTPACTETITQDIVVYAPTTPNAGTYGPVCLTAAPAPITLAGTPVGGTFSGTGVTGNSFNPATAGVGTHTITYTYTDGNGCTATATTDIVVNALPVVNAGTYAAVCIDAAPVVLAGTPVGGTFSGPGVSGNSFNPATAGAGSHTITYTYTDANGCTNTADATIVVNALPVVNAGTYAPVCVNATAPVNLAGTPAGGTFGGTGVTGTIFNPGLAGVGTHTITYTYNDANGCINTATTDIVVNAQPVVNAGTYAPVCVNATPVTLAGTPTGGTFTGTGVTGNSFNPATAGVGTHTITYSYTDGNGCSATATTTIDVTLLPVVDAGTYAAVCINAGPVALAGTPVGGTFTGTGVTGNTFDPAAAGVGSHTITYTYSDGSGCANTGTTTIVVNALPVVNAGTYAAVCVNASPVTLAGTPAGGTFTGTGVSGNAFDPAVAGAGTHTLTYDYTDANGCANTATTTITVNTLPVVNAGTYAAVCIDGGSVALAGTPVGGTFSGTGVTGNTFNPATAGAGTHTITYSYTDANGCANSATTDIVVNALPVIDAGNYGDVCANGTPITLAGTPAGGSFSGTGVTGNSFDPAVAGVGAHVITYTYTDANGCTNTTTTTINVNTVPVLDAGTYAPVCVDAAPVNLVGTPAGGTFTGPGVTGNTFDPAVAGAGSHIISYGNIAGCNSSTVTTTIVVNPLPVVDAGTYAAVCVDAAAVTLAGTPIGGTFSGTGVTGNTFDPATAGAGTHTITYAYTDGNGCAATATTAITVNALPVVDAGTYAAVCIDAAAVTLAGTPAGGTFSGTGVTGNTFDPATAGAGAHTITYAYTDANGCSATATTTITVNALPVLDAGTWPDICVNAAPFQLVGTPAGGAFGGPGVSNANMFDPTAAGTGTHILTYNYTDANGCSNEATTTINVNLQPTVDAGTYATVCINAAPVALAGTPVGGTFSGTGVTGNTFNPATAGPGTHTITYSYSDANGCANTGTTDITVNALPVVNAGTYAPVCINAAPVALAGTPAGGTFSGTGVTGNTFDPATAGAGTHTITYAYTDAAGCANSTTTNITVNALPVVDAGNYAAVCLNSAAVSLAGTPAGGTFSGPGVTGNMFNPATAGAGTHVITYNYTDANGCSNSDVANITVNTLPVVDAGTYADVCVNAAAVTLAGTPAGGTFSGPGVTGNSFNPATAGAGTHTVTYTYTGANGCSNTDDATIVVSALPVVNAGTYAPVCIDAAAVTLAGTPAGGTFSGTGVTGNSFNPATAGAGTHTVTYTFTNATGCTNTATTDITVNALPVVDAGTYAALCEEVSPITLAGTPAGGTFSGPGITGYSFNPATAGPGVHTITYSFTSASGCSQSNTTSIEVYSRPQVNFTIADADICLNESATITPSVVSGTVITWNWNLGNGNTPSYNNANPFTATFTAAMPYSIQVAAINDRGCVSEPVSKPLNVHSMPVADFEVPTKICLPGAASFTNLSSLDGSNIGLSYDWTFGDGGTSSNVNPSHTYAGPGSYNVTLTATSQYGCATTSAPKVVSDFYEKPHALFFVAPAEICQGENIAYDNQSYDPNSPIKSWSWTFGDGTTATGQNPGKQFNTPGNHTISLTVTNEAGCVSDPYVDDVTVYLQPVIDAGRSFVVPQGTPIQFEGTANSSSLTFQWSPPLGLSDPGSLRPSMIANGDQTYTLTAIGEHGCKATDFMTVKILKPVKIPNVFSPNGDGIHDKWDIPNLADYPGCTVQIFNRYGQQVFISSGYGTPWDGKYKGQDVPIGTYYYVIKLENGFKPVTGSVTIIR